MANQVNGLTDQSPKRKTSVTQEDFASGGAINFFVPDYGGLSGTAVPRLPQKLPPYSQGAYYTRRDTTMLACRQHEPLWANAISIAATKATAWGWGIEGSVPLRRKRAQGVLMNATAGVLRGFVPFAQAHLYSFLQLGRSIVEIEREKKGPSSRIRAIHHLNPLRCVITNDPEVPVLYLDRNGRVHQLKYWQVMILVDGASPALGDYGITDSPTERVYSTILTMSIIERYLYEKVSGNRALALHFIQGLTATSLKDAIQTADGAQAERGAMSYKGAAVVPVPGDTSVSLVTVPLAEIPDGFDAQSLKDDANVKYANAVGLDVNDVDPRLAARQALGSGAQSIVLNEKAKGLGLAAWRSQWTHLLNYWVMDTTTTFRFSEQSLDDDAKKAQTEQTKMNTIGAMIDKGLVSTEQGRNLAVDAGILPRDFSVSTVDGGNKLDDDDKPEEHAEARQTTKEETETTLQRARRLVESQIETAVSLVASMQADGGEKLRKM